MRFCRLRRQIALRSQSIEGKSKTGKPGQIPQRLRAALTDREHLT
jgi:hypothetical protein